MPSIFSLNATNGNHQLRPYIKDNLLVNVVDYSIYDRYGNRVFHRENLPSDDLNLIWRGEYDGSTITSGVYVYVITLDNNGETVTFSGDVTAVR